MSMEHRSVLAERFNCRDAPLFTEACGFPGEPLPDAEEAVRDPETNRVEVEAHVRMIIDRIIVLRCKFLSSPNASDGVELAKAAIANPVKKYEPSRFISNRLWPLPVKNYRIAANFTGFAV
jgi:hypothetical protein